MGNCWKKVKALGKIVGKNLKVGFCHKKEAGTGVSASFLCS
jgi:hypothetical protein